MGFPEILKERRAEKGLTQEAFGKLFGLSKQAISAYETGEVLPPPDTLLRLADFFNVSTDYLLGRTNDPTPHGTSGIDADYPELAKVLRRNGRTPTLAERRRIAKIIELAIEDTDDD